LQLLAKVYDPQSATLLVSAHLRTIHEASFGKCHANESVQWHLMLIYSDKMKYVDVRLIR